MTHMWQRQPNACSNPYPMQDTNPVDEVKPLEKPPIFKSWAGMYWLVLGNLAFLILLFYILTKIYE